MRMFIRTLVVVVLFSSNFAFAQKTASVDVVYKRTITDQRKDVGIIPATCNTTTTADWSLTVQVHVTANKLSYRDDGNNAQLDGRKLDGGGSYDYQMSSHTTGCKHDEDLTGSAHADLDTPNAHFGFDYTRKNDMGNVVIDPQWKEGSGKGTSKSKEGTADMSKVAVAQAAVLAGSMGPLALNTAQQWASYGPAAAQLKAPFAMLAQDEPVRIQQLPGGAWQLSYQLEHQFDVAKIDPPHGDGIKRTGTHTVHTEMTITITPAH